MSVRTIDECFYQIRNGANIKQGAVDGGYPITRIETTANDRFNRDRMGYAGITDIKKYENYVLQDGDLLMSHINSTQYLGRTVLYEKQGDEKIIHGMNLLGLKARRDIIIPAYARYCFYSQPFREQIGRITKKSVNQASFAVADLKKIKIIVPDLSEQCEVIDILNRVNQVIEDRQRELRKMDDLIKARFVELFVGKKYEIVKAGSIIKEMRNGVSPSTSGGHFEKVLTLSAITQGKFDDKAWKEGFFTDCPSAEKRITEDDFYICRGNGNKSLVGMGVYALENRPDLVFPDTVIAAHIDTERMVLPYLWIMWQQPEVRKQLESGARTTNGTYKINQKVISEIKIICPPINEQEVFADFVKQVNKSKVKVQKALDETQKLFDSLMQQYFG